MDLPSKPPAQIVFNNRRKIQRYILVVMDKTKHEKILCQPLQTNIKQY